jgi:hypothetical protein
LAGFQVIFIGRFWVIPEARGKKWDDDSSGELFE